MSEREVVVEITQEVAPIVEVDAGETQDVEVVVQDETTRIVEMPGDQGSPGRIGDRGIQGPTGPTGPMGLDFYYRHQQTMPAFIWYIPHNAGKRPAWQVFNSAGDEVEGVIVHVDDFNTRIEFTAPFGGEAYGT